MRRRSISRCVVPLLLALFAPSARVAHAQATWEELLRPNLSQSDFDECIAALHFDDPAQETVFRRLFEDLAAQYATEATRIKAEQARIEQQNNAFADAHPHEDAWTSQGEDFGASSLYFSWFIKRFQMESRFEQDVNAFLVAGNQQATWAKVTRRIRRHELERIHEFSRARFGEDLLLILQSLPLNEAERQRTAIPAAEYELQIDETLRQYQAEINFLNLTMMSISSSVTKQKGGLDADPEKRKHYDEASRRAEELRRAVVDTNKQFAPRIAECLNEANRIAFLDAIDRFNYPHVFLPGPVEMAGEALVQIDWINPARQKAINAILDDYFPQRDALRQKTISAIQRWEDPVAAAARWARIEKCNEKNDDDGRRAILGENPVIDLLWKRHALAQDACRHMRGLFSDEEFAKFPLKLRLMLSW